MLCFTVYYLTFPIFAAPGNVEGAWFFVCLARAERGHLWASTANSPTALSYPSLRSLIGPMSDLSNSVYPGGCFS